MAGMVGVGDEAVRHKKASDPAELRRETHRRRVLAHLEKAAREGPEPQPEAAQMKAPLIGEGRRPESKAKPPRRNAKIRTRKAVQLDLRL